MEINTGILSAPVQTTSKTNKMGFDESANAMLFSFLTGDMYENPIGSIVREIASNCFDSHVEAGTDSTKNPVVIRIQNNEEVGKQSYISFIDKGVGINPDRMTNIYGNYFCSTKRTTNDLIGGFGLGGKTPLTYAPDGFFMITVADKQDDIDFTTSMINTLNANIETAKNQIRKAETSEGATDKDGNTLYTANEIEDMVKAIPVLKKDIDAWKQEISEMEQRLLQVGNIKESRVEYTYSIFIGENSPEFQLMNMKGTKAVKGTEIKVPIKRGDIPKFERNVKSQLYYFENIIFEGFSDYNGVTNEYTLYKGKNFIFRGSDYSTRLHVVYGNVAYPVNFEELELDEYRYRIPIGVKLKIGELEGTGVTPNREAINHTPENIKIIKDKIELAIDELVELLKKQNENVRTFEDYLKVRNKLTTLHITEDETIDLSSFTTVKPSDLVNFEYKELPHIPSNTNILELFYTVKQFGKQLARWDKHYNRAIDTLDDHNSLVSVEKEFNRKVLKQSYFNNGFGTWYLHIPMIIKDESQMIDLMKNFKLLDYVEPNNIKSEKDYDYVVKMYNYDEHYKVNIKKTKAVKLIHKIRKEVINIVRANTIDYDTFVVPKHFIEQKNAEKKAKKSAIKNLSIPAKVYTSSWGYQRTVELADLDKFNGTIVYGFQEHDDKLGECADFARQLGMPMANSYDCPKTGMWFARISKQNEKYIKQFGRRCIHVDHFYNVYLSRKGQMFINAKIANELNDMLYRVHHYISHPAMEKADPILYNNYNLLKQSIPETIDVPWISDEKLYKYAGVKRDVAVEEFGLIDELKELVRISENSSKFFGMLNAPNWDSQYTTDKMKEQFVGLLSLCIVK